MKTLFHARVVFAVCTCVTGCAVTGASPPTTATAAASAISARNASDAITVGKSTRTDVIAALGKTTVISFDSGFEVWVYQVRGEMVTGEPARGASRVERSEPAASERRTRGNAEFVVLFAPSGVVAKTRIRPPPAPGEVKGS